MSVAVLPDEARWIQDWICTDCGAWFQLSYRASSELKRTKRPAICRECRYPRQPLVTDGLQDWWAERFSEGEIVEMAEAIWGPRYLWNL